MNWKDADQQVEQFRAKQALALPPTHSIAISNLFGPGSTLTVIPEDGTLWVFYEYGNAKAQMIEVWHQGGRRTPVHLGENPIPVGANDFLVYQLANPAVDTITVGYQIQ